MLDMVLSVVVIVNAKRPDVAGFEYLYAYIRSNDPRWVQKAQKHAAVWIKHHLELMTPEDQEAAQAYLARSKARSYWYSDRFSGPDNVIRTYKMSDLSNLWRGWSSATHGGYAGMRMLRADPSRLNLNPRKDPETEARTIVLSTQVIIELLNIWDGFVGGHGPEYHTISELIAQVGLPES
jgi:hypothetical protein